MEDTTLKFIIEVKYHPVMKFFLKTLHLVPSQKVINYNTSLDMDRDYI